MDNTTPREPLSHDAPPETPLVYIIDTDCGVQRDLQALLSSVNISSEVFSSVADFIDRTHLPDVASCLVLDVRLPGVSGLDFQESLARSGASIPVIFLTGYADIRMTVRAMKSGAIDFLTKPFREQDVLDAVSAALDSDRQRRRVLEEWASIRRRCAKLTEREREVMQRVAAGRLNKQIACDLNISEPTVKVHRSSVMRKLDVRTVPDLVRLADTIIANTAYVSSVPAGLHTSSSHLAAGSVADMRLTAAFAALDSHSS